MKKIRIILVAFFLILNLFALRRILLRSYKESKSINSFDYIYKWWDIVEIKKKDKLCSSDLFQNTFFLKVSCKDNEIAKWLIDQKDKKVINYLSIVPAHSLFYNLNQFNHKKIKYLTITWNDFSNRSKALEKLENVFNLIKEDCTGNNRVVFIVFPTSDSTITGSKNNFQSEEELTFSQEIIEDKLINNKSKCISKKVYLEKDTEGKRVYWLDFLIDGDIN